ncbi:ALF repeat-containing protein [Streptomyces sp. A1-5]|uniref:ALF repeat-containing protein n=1 Tax=Streptomyces sp. A1-5 TaxID=2738410 RepID=UPI001F30572A|nr:ALF repeat-containing protein [Streptomyces sp. A1-5]
MKLARVSAVVAAAAIAPAVLFSSPAMAADRGASPANSAPDASPETKPAESAGEGDASAERDRMAILRMLADKNIGKGLEREAQRALDGGPEAMRHFLDVGQYEARAKDEANAEAEAKRRAEEEAAKKKPTPTTGDGGEDGERGDGTATTAEPAKPGTGGDSTGGVRPAVASPLGTGSAPSAGDRQLAATGVGPATPWALGGSALALTAGAGLVVAARRRTSAGH